MTYNVRVQQIDAILLVVADDDTGTALAAAGRLLAVAWAGIDVKTLVSAAEKQADGVAVGRSGELVVGLGNTAEDLDVIELL